MAGMSSLGSLQESIMYRRVCRCRIVDNWNFLRIDVTKERYEFLTALTEIVAINLKCIGVTHLVESIFRIILQIKKVRDGG